MSSALLLGEARGTLSKVQYSLWQGKPLGTCSVENTENEHLLPAPLWVPGKEGLLSHWLKICFLSERGTMRYGQSDF